MNTYVIQRAGYNVASSHDEFGQWSNLGNTDYSTSYHRLFKTQDKYFIVVDGCLRDREFDETLQEFTNWICRLAKRVLVDYVLVEVRGYSRSYLFTNRNCAFERMYEWPGNSERESNWCEYMMYECCEGSYYPKLLERKYLNERK